MINKIWKEATDDIISWAENFKDIFINQKRNNIEKIFLVEEFGLHNGMNLEEYLDHESQEFQHYSTHFNLNNNSTAKCYLLDHNYFYININNAGERALFEGIYLWDQKSRKVIGNQYSFKIEPKIEFVKNNGKVFISRKINITPAKDNDVIYIVTTKSGTYEQDLSFNNNHHDTGGDFYTLRFSKEDDQFSSYWEQIIIHHNIREKTRNKRKLDVLMRGTDHPLFIDNLFPIINGRQLTIPPAIDKLFFIYIKLSNDKEIHIKYPEGLTLVFEDNIKKATITDPLGYDWTVVI